VNKEIEGKTTIYDEDLSTLKAEMESSKMNFQLMQRRMNDVPLRVTEGIHWSFGIHIKYS
jgi:hypothetical protein